jgi:ABC-type multidrug transport system permease subunit
MAAGVDPVLVGLVVVMLAFVFGVYLLVRRTLLSMREGFERGKQ